MYLKYHQQAPVANRLISENGPFIALGRPRAAVMRKKPLTADAGVAHTSGRMPYSVTVLFPQLHSIRYIPD